MTCKTSKRWVLLLFVCVSNYCFAQTTVTYKSYGSSTSIGVAPPIPAITDSTVIQIPIDGNRWYQLDNVSNGLQALSDGDTTTAVNTGYGLVLSNFDAYYPVADDEAMDIYQIKLYSSQGNFSATPMTLYGIDSAGNKTLIAIFIGGLYNKWIGPTGSTTNFTLSSPLRHIRYLDLNTSANAYPTEMRIYGIYKSGAAPTPAVPAPLTLSQMFGVNGFEWDFENPNNTSVISPAQLAAGESFTQFRHYLDWNKLEPTQGGYTFNPSHSGSWNYDTLYYTLQKHGIMVLADIKTLPQWMVNTYPTAMQDAENVPVPYGSDFSNPNSYIDQAKLAFQYAARYGSNKNVNLSLLSVDPSLQWVGDAKNIVRVGLGLVKYVECDNERDKWWKGTQAYQTAYEYAANLSAFYDGNKNTMGPGVGVKNADPTMQVVMCGVALPTTDYVRGMVDWCKIHRGYKADGTVNLCWDVINYHFYSNNAGTSQGGNPTAGAAPELSGTALTAQSFITAAHQYVQDMPVWVTELGYDINQGSPLKAYPIGAKSALQVQADWILRSALLYARAGVQRTFCYEMYDNDSSNSVKFESSGLINANYGRRPAADYMYQANRLLGAYTYSSTISSSPFVDIYNLNGNNAYVLAMPTENGSTANYVLNLNQADSALVYTPAIGQDSMSVQRVKTTNGQLNLTVTETPMFVIPFDSIICFIPVAGSNGAVCEGTTLSLTSTTTANATFSWSGPNGFTSTLQNPTIPAAIAADSGLYTVTLTANGCTSTDSVNAIVNHKPALTINAPVAVCAPVTVDITAPEVTVGSTKPFGTILNYYTDAAGTIALANPNAVTASGTNYIKATAPAGCSDIQPVAVIVNAQPIFTAASTTCTADALSYSIAITVSAGTLTSNVGTVTNPSPNNWLISGIRSGSNANLALSVTSGCTNILVVNAPDCSCPFIGSPTSGGDQTQCAQTTVQTLTATATPAAGYSVRWFTVVSGGTPVVNPTLNTIGTITYYAEAYDPASPICGSSRTAVTLTINPIPAAPLSGGDQIVCKGDPIQLLTATATASPAATTVWYSSLTDTTVVNPDWSSIGSVTYYAQSDALGCNSTTRTAVTLTIVDPPHVSVSETNQTINIGSATQLTAYIVATPGDVPTYAWITDYNISSNISSPGLLTIIVAPAVDTAYLFEAVSSLLPTCKATATAYVNVLQPVSIPNSFSPNGDGIHDTWYIKLLDEYPNAEVQIFNRDGQEVYESTGNYLEAPWTGNFNGQPLPVGTYYYIINLNSGTSISAAPLTGSVSIIK